MSESKSSNNPPTKGRTFLNRTLSSAWAWGVVLVAITLDKQWFYLTMFMMMVLVGLNEYFNLVPEKGLRRFQWQTIAVSLGFSILMFSNPLFGWDRGWMDRADGLAIAAVVFLIVLDRIRFGLDGYRMIDEIAIAVFGFVYIVILFGFVLKLLHMPIQGENRFYVVFLLIVTKFTDMGAYLVGSVIGKHKMIPKISPGKTWEGFGGALFFALLGSFGSYFLFKEKIPLITPLHAGILGVILALVAVLGDLVESIIKRSFGAKDSGHIMPGIGGVLDLIDSILLTAPVLYFYLLVL